MNRTDAHLQTYKYIIQVARCFKEEPRLAEAVSYLSFHLWTENDILEMDELQMDKDVRQILFECKLALLELTVLHHIGVDHTVEQIMHRITRWRTREENRIRKIEIPIFPPCITDFEGNSGQQMQSMPKELNALIGQMLKIIKKRFLKR